MRRQSSRVSPFAHPSYVALRCPPLGVSRRGRRLFLLRAQRLLVAFQRFGELLELVEDAALIQVCERERVIRRDRLIVAGQRLLPTLKPFEGCAFLYQRFSMPGIQCERFFKAAKRLI